VYPAVLLMHFIPAADILLVSLASIVYVSLTYNKTGRASDNISYNYFYIEVSHVLLVYVK
jgi:hypothetical protein